MYYTTLKNIIYNSTLFYQALTMCKQNVQTKSVFLHIYIKEGVEHKSQNHYRSLLYHQEKRNDNKLNKEGLLTKCT